MAVGPFLYARPTEGGAGVEVSHAVAAANEIHEIWAAVFPIDLVRICALVTVEVESLTSGETGCFIAIFAAAVAPSGGHTYLVFGVFGEATKEDGFVAVYGSCSQVGERVYHLVALIEGIGLYSDLLVFAINGQ